jgi:transcriptional regulator with XRE-family HTH domain
MSLRQIRKARGLSIEHVALIAGVHKSTVSRAERGLQMLQPRTVVRLSKALGVSPSRITDPK